MSELNPVRIAVIGAGAMGRNHIRFVTEEPEAELVAIADAFEGARATAEAAGVPFFTDPAQMMDEVKPEAVIIATPNDLHLGVAREAVKRNIVPLVEKPISNDLEDAQAFAAEAETAGVPVLVGQHRRHNPFVNKAKEIIESGELGKLTVSSFHYMIYKNDEYFDVEWRRKKGAGPILVNLVHDVDLLRYLLGEPVAVQGMQSSAARGFETEDSAVVNVRFADGALASMTISDATAGTGRPPLARTRSTVPSTPTPTLSAELRAPFRCPACTSSPTTAPPTGTSRCRWRFRQSTPRCRTRCSSSTL